MGIDLDTRMRLLGISNTIMVYAGLWIFVSFPFPFSGVFFDVPTLIWLTSILFLDYIMSILFIKGFSGFITADIQRKYNIIRIGWYIISGLTRLLTASYISYTITANSFPILIPYLMAISSILFGLLLFYIRGTRICINVKGRLRLLIILNFFSATFFFTPLGFQLSIQNIAIGYLILIIISGFLKTMTYLISAWIWFGWSFNIVKLDEDDKHLYPTQSSLYPDEAETIG